MHNQLTNTGISCNIKEKNLLIKPYIITCCVDAPARAAVQGIKQYNGYYGCNWCVHPGWKEGLRDPVTYPLLDTVPRLRTHEETVNIMTNCAESEGELGIKYPSPLICLPYFNIVDGIIPDYMHSCLEGVAARMLNYFLDNMTDNTIEELDEQMKKIKPPDQLQRLTRLISERDDWKAREWENFVLYYSIPILKSKISERKFNHWLLFVEGLYIVLQDKIDISELDRANVLFHNFVADMADNHEARAMTYNTHILLHICRSVFNWGPVWANSTFCFESANQHVLNAIKCARGASHQVVRFVNQSHSLLNLENSLFPIENQDVLNYCSEVLESKAKNALTMSLALKKKRSNNSFALLKDGTYIQILKFIVDEENELQLTQGYKLQIKNVEFNYARMKQIDRIDELISTIATTEIFKICIFIEMNVETHFICEMPNMLHY
ncbi:hypothetical protein TKK_0015345 [Trichogramma kaykai]